MPPKRLNPVFITGTDTGVGKTLVTGLLAKYIAARGIHVITQKWVQTGCAGAKDSDIQAHLDIMQVNKEILPQQIPYLFKFPASPHLAAAKENSRINIEKIKADFEYLFQHYGSVIAEGAGGVYVPFTENNLAMDMVVRLTLPVVVVVANKLGGINSALLTLEYLKVRKIKVIGMVFNDMPDTACEILEDNPQIVHKISGLPVLGRLPFDKDITVVERAFDIAGGKIWEALLR